MSYKITTKSGRIYKASKVEHKPGFLEMHCWDGEHRIPAGEVTYIKTTEIDEISEIILPIFLFSFVFFLLAIIYILAQF